MRKRSNVAGIVAAAAAGFVMSGHAQAQETGAGATTTAKPMSGNLISITQAMLDGLLQAVIAHWKVLGKTSPAGLRETFLCREGRLDTKADQQGWSRRRCRCFQYCSGDSTRC